MINFTPFPVIETNRVDDKGYFGNRIYSMIVYRIENSN